MLPRVEGEEEKPSEGGVGWDWPVLLRLWIEEGLDEADFWRQTGNTFQIVMNARFEARKNRYRDDTILAWQIGNFAGAAFAGKLKDLSHYLADPTEDKSRGGAQLLGLFMSMKKRGAPIKIERLQKTA